MFFLSKSKKVFINFMALKKITVLFILLSVSAGIIIPADCYAEGITEGIVNYLLDAILNAVFSLLIVITAPILSISYSVLDWVTSPDFISVSFTGTDNPVVQQGWKMVRDFTYMFIVLSFVIVALATILGIKEYQAQKLLPVLIGVTLLINFTPVICGFIIDISNVAMNYFLSGATLDKGIQETIKHQTDDIWHNEEIDIMDKLATGIIYPFFNIGAAIIFFLFSALFFFRYIALWILIIMSPIVFFCYAIPITRSAWSMWWNQFFQWCIIGVPAAFFIYLSNFLMEKVSDGTLTSSPTGELNNFGKLFTYIVPLAFLVIGFFASLKTGAIGADKIIGGFQTLHGKAVTGAVTGIGKTVGDTALVKGTKEKIERMEGKVSEYMHPTQRGRIRARIEQREKRNKIMERDENLMEHASIEERELMAKKGPVYEKIAKFRVNTRQGVLNENDKSNLKIVQLYGEPKDINDAVNKRLDWAADADPDKVAEIKAEIQVETPGISDEDAQKEAEKRVIQKKVQGRTPLKLRQETQPEALEHPDVLDAMNDKQREEIWARGSEKQKLAMLKNAKTFITMDIQRLEEIKRTGSEAMKKAIKELVNNPEQMEKIDSVFYNLEAEARAGNMESLKKASDLQKKLEKVVASPEFY